MDEEHVCFDWLAGNEHIILYVNQYIAQTETNTLCIEKIIIIIVVLLATCLWVEDIDAVLVFFFH